jgi:enoyl-CoA hydratase
MESVLTETLGTTFVVTLNRPRRRNAIDRGMAVLLASALDQFDGNETLRVCIVTGAEGVFCSGRDLRAFLDGDDPSLPGTGLGGMVRRSLTKPLIAAVEGFAVAGGFEIALACDLIVAARGARFGLPEARRALVPSGGALRRLPQRATDGLVLELALTGELVDAARLHSLGVINRLVEPGQALACAQALAEEIARSGPLAVAAIKRLVRAQHGWTEAEFWANQSSVTDPIFASEDASEGAAAFVEHREPVWRGL